MPCTDPGTEGGEFSFQYNEFEVASCETFGGIMRRKLDVTVRR